MAPQAPPSSSSGDGSNNNGSLIPRSDLKFVVKRLCRITGLSTDGEDICSQDFVDRLLEYVEEDYLCLESIRKKFAERRSVRQGTQRVDTPETQTPSTCHSNGYAISSELSPTEPNENESVVEVPASSRPPPEVITIPSEPHITSPHSSSNESGVTFDVPPPSDRADVPGKDTGSSSPPLCVISNTFCNPTPILTATDTKSNGNNNANLITPLSPPLPSMLPSDGHQNVDPSFEDLKHHPNNEAFGGASSRVQNDNFINELIQQPPTPTRRSSRMRKARHSNKVNRINTVSGHAEKMNTNKKRRNKQARKTKSHGWHWHGDRLGCICRFKFSCKQALKRHINYHTAEKKFKCKICQQAFYFFHELRKHLEKKHKMQNALAEYETGCSKCGIMFHTRAELFAHQKGGHKIPVKAKKVALVASSSHHSDVTPLEAERSAPFKSTGEIPIQSARKTPLRSGGTTPAWSGGESPWRPSFLSGMLPVKPESGIANSPKHLRCKRKNTLKYELFQCNSCEKKFVFECKFKKHQLECRRQTNSPSRPSDCNVALPHPHSNGSTQIEVVDLVSDDEEQQIDTHVGEDASLSVVSQQAIINISLSSSLPPNIVHQQNSSDVMNCNQSGSSSADTSVNINRHNGSADHGKSYGCAICSQVFMELCQLRSHVQQHEENKNDKRVRCGLCDEVFGGCKSFHAHRNQQHRLVSYHEKEKQTESPSPPSTSSRQVDDDGNPKLITKSFSIKKFPYSKDNTLKYFCDTCCRKAFKAELNWLISHRMTYHKNAVRVECSTCKKGFQKCKPFHQHRCSKKPEEMPKDKHLQQKKQKKKAELALKKAETETDENAPTKFKIPRKKPPQRSEELDNYPIIFASPLLWEEVMENRMGEEGER